MSKINWILVIICIIDEYRLLRKNHKIKELENELFELKYLRKTNMKEFYEKERTNE